MKDSAWKEILDNEFSAGPSSFLIQMRCDFVWDKKAFTRMTKAMEQCCAELEGATEVDRHLADNFWYLSWFVETWTTHPNYPRPHSDEYYQRAYQLLFELAVYFFSGQHPMTTRQLTFPE